MSSEEKIDPDLMMGLIEDELEERKSKNDRRKQDCEDSMKQVTETERRKNEDRREADA
ncbi:MAG: hypothetical protein OEY36_09320 [Gammaproteobacteria bacterium]|nr:hypothetical protein [Gammaproteobacteria bacterium]